MICARLFKKKLIRNDCVCMEVKGKKPCGAVIWLYTRKKCIIITMMSIIAGSSSTSSSWSSLSVFFSSSLVLRGVRRKVLHATSPVYSLYSMIVVCVVTSYYGLVEMMVVWFCSGYCCSFSDLSLLYRDFSNYKIGIKRVKLRERKKWKTRFSLKNKMIFFSSPVMTSLSPSCTL